jgi:hypothetical protein
MQLCLPSPNPRFSQSRREMGQPAYAGLAEALTTQRVSDGRHSAG